MPRNNPQTILGNIFAWILGLFRNHWPEIISWEWRCRWRSNSFPSAITFSPLALPPKQALSSRFILLSLPLADPTIKSNHKNDDCHDCNPDHYCLMGWTQRLFLLHSLFLLSLVDRNQTLPVLSNRLSIIQKSNSDAVQSPGFLPLLDGYNPLKNIRIAMGREWSPHSSM